MQMYVGSSIIHPKHRLVDSVFELNAAVDEKLCFGTRSESECMRSTSLYPKKAIVLFHSYRKTEVLCFRKTMKCQDSVRFFPPNRTSAYSIGRKAGPDTLSILSKYSRLILFFVPFEL